MNSKYGFTLDYPRDWKIDDTYNKGINPDTTMEDGYIVFSTTSDSSFVLGVRKKEDTNVDLAFSRGFGLDVIKKVGNTMFLNKSVSLFAMMNKEFVSIVYFGDPRKELLEFGDYQLLSAIAFAHGKYREKDFNSSIDFQDAVEVLNSIRLKE